MTSESLQRLEAFLVHCEAQAQHSECFQLMAGDSSAMCVECQTIWNREVQSLSEVELAEILGSFFAEAQE